MSATVNHPNRAPVLEMELHLLIYDDLSAEDRREADAYLESHPEARRIVEQGRSMRSIFREAASPPADHLEVEDSERVDEVVDSLPPAREHLAALMSEAHEERSVRRAAADRASIRGSRRRHAGVWAAAMIVVLALGLFITSVTSQEPHERIAALQAVPQTIPGLTLRSDEVTSDQVSDAYLAALDLVHDARSSMLGLFPEYDEAQLSLAMEHLTEAARMDPAGAIGLEALYLRGRIHLYLGEIEEAEQDLALVIERSGPSASEARRMQDEIGERLGTG